MSSRILARISNRVRQNGSRIRPRWMPGPVVMRWDAMSSQPPETPEDSSGHGSSSPQSEAPDSQPAESPQPGQSPTPDSDPGAQPGPSDPSVPGGADTEGVYISPLLSDDPLKIGDFWLDGRLGAAAAGVAFTGHDDADTPAMILLLSQGAADDAAARDRFSGVVNTLHIDTVLARGGRGQDAGRLGTKFQHAPDPAAPDERQPAPWAALAYDGSPQAAAEAERILREVELSWLPQQGQPSGPDYRLYWINKVKPGLTRLWPLPWPGRYARAGWKTILMSWFLVLLLAALAVLIAILIFRNEPPQSPPQQAPRTASPPPQGGSPSPQSGSPSPQSGSPSSESGSPSKSPSKSKSGSPGKSPSKSPSKSKSGSPSPSGTESGGGKPSNSGSASGSPSPRSKL